MSQQDAEKTYAVIPRENTGVLHHVKYLVEFLGKVQQEMKLVHYPNWREVRSTTLVVIAFVSLFAAYLRVLEWIYSPLQNWLFSR